VKEVEYLNYKDHDGVPIFEGKEDKLGVHTHARVVAKLLWACDTSEWNNVRAFSHHRMHYRL